MKANTIAITDIMTCISSSFSSSFEKFDFIVQILWGYYVDIGWKGFHDVFDIMQRGMDYVVFVEFLERLPWSHARVNLLRQTSEKFTCLAIPFSKVNVFVK